MLHTLKPLGYVRYGDDFVLWLPDELSARRARLIGSQFIMDELRLSINPKHDIVQPSKNKLAYLGVDLWPNGQRLNKRVQQRAVNKLTAQNAASYQSIIQKQLPGRYSKKFLWNLIDLTD